MIANVATAKPALMGPDAAVNGTYYNHIQSITDPNERRRFVEEKRAEDVAGIDGFKLTNEKAIEAVVPGDELRDELISRFARYRRRRARRPRRNNPVTPA